MFENLASEESYHRALLIPIGETLLTKPSLLIKLIAKTSSSNLNKKRAI
jgi:hypothetical protein